MKVEGAAILVSGGASGLGEATVRRLHGEGARVTISDLDEKRGEAVSAELGVRFVRADVRDGAEVEAAVDAAASLPGGLRAAVSCAGTDVPQKIAGRDGPASQEQFERTIAINLTGTFNVWRLAAARMLDNDPDEGGERGCLLATASVAAFEGQVGQVNYSASKAGLVGMTLPVARDLAPSGIRANTIAPGLFDTPLLAGAPEPLRKSLAAQVPFPSRLGDPSEFAHLVQSILENQMLNGQVFRIDGAIRMAPR